MQKKEQLAGHSINIEGGALQTLHDSFFPGNNAKEQCIAVVTAAKATAPGPAEELAVVAAVAVVAVVARAERSYPKMDLL